MNPNRLFAALMICTGLGCATAHAQHPEPLDTNGTACIREVRSVVKETHLRGYYDYVVESRNSCSQKIALEVCETGTPHCTELVAHPGISDVSLGTASGIKPFVVEWMYRR